MHKVVKEISWYAEQQIAAKLDKLGIQRCGGSEQSWCCAHWGMGLIFHQAKPRWTWREEDSKSSVLDLGLDMRS